MKTDYRVRVQLTEDDITTSDPVYNAVSRVIDRRTTYIRLSKSLENQISTDKYIPGTYYISVWDIESLI